MPFLMLKVSADLTVPFWMAFRALERDLGGTAPNDALMWAAMCATSVLRRCLTIA